MSKSKIISTFAAANRGTALYHQGLQLQHAVGASGRVADILIIWRYENSLDIKLFDTYGKLISSGNGNIEMSSYPNGIYIVTDGKGGFLKINHYR